MKKIFLSVLFSITILYSSTLVVDNNPSSGWFGEYSCEAKTFPDNPYHTIQNAINAAGDDDTISICDGNYNESVTVNKNNLTIKRSDDADANVDVNISNKNKSVFIINAVNTLHIESLYIEQTEKKAAIAINSYSKKITLANLFIKAKSGDGIESNGGNEEITVKQTAIVAGDDGIDFNDNINGGFTIEDSNISAQDKGITADNTINGGVAINNVQITADNTALKFYKKINNGVTLSGIFLQSDNNAIDFNDEVNGGINISDLNITAKKNGIEFKKVNNGLTISDTNITTDEKGLKCEEDLNGGVTISEMEITSAKNAIQFSKKINNGISISSSDINSTSGRGIDFQDSVYNDLNISDVNITAYDRGLYFNSKQMSPIITNSNIKSTHNDAVYTKNSNWSKFTLKDSCVKSIYNGKFGLWINNNSTNAEVKGNCLYATTVNKLAKAKKAGNDVSGNYWDGNSGDYNLNKISDTDTLSSCPLSCGETQVIPKPKADWQMDECSWNGTNGEVKDSSGNDYNGTAYDADTTADAKINRAGDLNATGTDDYLDLDHNAADGLKNFTITAWIKTTATQGQAILSGAKDNTFGGSNELLMYFTNKKTFKPHIKNKGKEISLSKNINDGNWHFITWRREVGSTDKNCFFLDGSLEGCVDLSSGGGAVSIASGGLIAGQEQDSLGGGFQSDQSFVGTIDELKIFDSKLSDSQISHIFNNESNGKNYDGTDRPAPQCGGNTPPKNYKFDAWDTFRDINDRNISTKIVAKEFNLTIASLNESNDDYQEFNGTVCATVDNNISKLLFNDQNSSTATFTIQNALKDIRVHLSWKKDVDENCPLTDEDNETNTTDNFAVRPEKFLITGNSASIFAGDDFNLSFNALDADGSDTDDYNETTANASFTIEANSTKAGCINGTLHIDDINFTNGVASDINTTYSNIGDVNITIKDSNDSSSFAYVDHDDTNESQRLISPATASIYVKPYELNITDVSFQPSTDKDWLYMADNINDMNITLDTIVKAFNKQGDILQDFNETCYAQDVNVTFYYDLNNSNSDINLTLDGNLTSNDVNISDINKTLQIPKKLFIDGEANSSYAFGIDRNYYDYKNPVNVVLKDVNVTTQNISKELQGKLLESDNNATFYFARTYTQDLATSQSSDTTKAEILIYSDHPLKDDNNVSLQEELLNWYLNTMHTDNSFGNITNTTPSKSIQKSATTDITTSAASITNGISTIEVNTTNDTKGSYFIHLDENRWLWYVAQNFGSDYNDSDNSKCTEHPCIKYTYEQKSLGHAVKSGTTTGVHFESSDVNVSKNNQGVRLFR